MMLDNKEQEIKMKSTKEYIDLSDPVNNVKKLLDKFADNLELFAPGSFDGDAGEYKGFEGGDDKLYEKRFKKLSAWEKKVEKNINSLMSDYLYSWYK